MEKVFSFSSKDFSASEDLLEKMGIRGRRLAELASQDVPVLPGFILPNKVVLNGDPWEGDYKGEIDEALTKMGEIQGKSYGAVDGAPLLVKFVISPELKVVDTVSSIHNVGLCDGTFAKFSSFVGESFAYHEYRSFIVKVLNLEMAVTPNSDKEGLQQKMIEALKSAKTVASSKKTLAEVRKLFPEDFFTDAYAQFAYVVSLYKKYFVGNEILGDSALLVQGMAFGNYGKGSLSGECYTRDIVTGEPGLSGTYHENAFDASGGKPGKAIEHLDRKIVGQLEKIATALEKWFKEIRWIRFAVEGETLWVVDQHPAVDKTVRAELRTLLDLHASGDIDDAHLINELQPKRLASILHPVIDAKSAKKVSSVKGGIAGSMGAASGKVYFTTERLIKEQKIALQRGQNPGFLLVMPSTYAEDVKAIEAGSGVLSRDGGYSSHAPVVARSLGKVAMVYPKIEFRKDAVKIGDRTVKEGDILTLDVPSSGKPVIYFGAVDLIKPALEDSGLIEFLETIQKHIGDFDVRANADQPKDAQTAKTFKACGIGLCRTEHMFFDEKRILLFRSMIIADSRKEREKLLGKLKKFQVADFQGLFKVMEGDPVTIRLLDAPLHEFLPHTRESMDEFVTYCKKVFPGIGEEEIRLRCDILAEENPMLGHRGVRLAVSYPEIYNMQVSAIFEAAYKLQSEEKLKVRPEIMLPLVMSSSEIKAFRYGKRIEGKEIEGIIDIEKRIRAIFPGQTPIPYKVGAMIELPVAALRADEIALYADFISFGTNDLTQTTYGLSRDDFNGFFTDYNEFDILESNPFQILGDQVRGLIQTATARGRMTRPDLKVGLCGEHGAESENIVVLRQYGLNYVSCSPYGIPVVKLTLAQMNIAKEAG